MTEAANSKDCCAPVNVPASDAATTRIKAFYDKAAAGVGPYDSAVDKFSPSGPTEHILALARAAAGGAILDIGCGMGTTLLQILGEAPQFKQLLGVDFSEKMIDRARERAFSLAGDLRRKIGFFAADAQALPYMDEQFDFIYSECVLNLLPRRECGVAEQARLLKSGGTLVYTDFVARKPVPEFVRRNLELVSGCRAGSVTLEENVELLTKYGFESIALLDFTENKNQRYRELVAESEEIRRDHEDLRRRHPETHRFLNEDVAYFVIVARRGAR